MVCYARPASRMAALLLVVFLVFGRSAGHFLDSAALFVGIAVAVAVAAVAAAVAFTMFLSVRRRRAAAGGCVSCQLRCQHAMTEQPRRLLLVSTVDRSAAGVGRAGRMGLLGCWACWGCYAAVAGSAGYSLRGGFAAGSCAARGVAARGVVAGDFAALVAPRPVLAPRAAGRERTGSAVLPAFLLGLVLAGPDRGVGGL